MQNPSKETIAEWQKNPKYWKLGALFYYNKEDERLIVDKPNPNYGTTLNFAHKKSYLILLVSFLFFGFIGYIITRNQ